MQHVVVFTSLPLTWLCFLLRNYISCWRLWRLSNFCLVARAVYFFSPNSLLLHFVAIHPGLLISTKEGSVTRMQKKRNRRELRSPLDGTVRTRRERPVVVSRLLLLSEQRPGMLGWRSSPPCATPVSMHRPLFPPPPGLESSTAIFRGLEGGGAGWRQPSTPPPPGGSPTREGALRLGTDGGGALPCAGGLVSHGGGGRGAFPAAAWPGRTPRAAAPHHHPAGCWGPAWSCAAAEAPPARARTRPLTTDWLTHPPGAAAAPAGAAPRAHVLLPQAVLEALHGPPRPLRLRGTQRRSAASAPATSRRPAPPANRKPPALSLRQSRRAEALGGRDFLRCPPPFALFFPQVRIPHLRAWAGPISHAPPSGWSPGSWVAPAQGDRLPSPPRRTQQPEVRERPSRKRKGVSAQKLKAGVGISRGGGTFNATH